MSAASLLLSTDEANEYLQDLSEYALVEAAIGGGFDSTEELRVMKYKEAMQMEDKPQ